MSNNPESKKISFLFQSAAKMSSSSEEENPDGGPYNKSSKVRRLWTSLKIMFLRHGLTEVDRNHPEYVLIECIRSCVRHHIPKVLTSDHLHEAHYSEVKRFKTEVRLEPEKRVVKTEFTAYAPTVFEAFRSGLGVSKEEFLKSIAQSGENFYHHKSNSKGKHLFFFTNDMRFLIKFEKAKNVRFFRSHTEAYIDHFIASPHSLIVKIIGLFSIRLGKKSKKTHFIVMKSIFWPEAGIQKRFDIKGCLRGRYESIPNGRSESDVVLKDKNFLGMLINMGSQRSWFMEQLDRDVKFLKRLGIMDYSILVGIQEGNKSTRPESLAELVSSIKRSAHGISQTKNNSTNIAATDKKIVNVSALLDDFVEFLDDGTVHLNEAAFDRIDSGLSNASFLADILQDSPRRRLKEKIKQGEEAAEEENRTLQTESLTALEKEESVVGRFTMSSKSNRFFQVHPAPKGEENLSQNWDESCRISIRESANLKDAMNHFVRSAVRTKGSASGGCTGQRNKIRPMEESIKKDGNPAMNYDPQFTDRIEGAESKTSQYWQGENRRLLPDHANGIHILEGVDSRYYLGIIDIFKTYGVSQKIARILKTLKFCDGDHSSAPPDVYAKRFIEFMECHLT